MLGACQSFLIYALIPLHEMSFVIGLLRDNCMKFRNTNIFFFFDNSIVGGGN